MGQRIHGWVRNNCEKRYNYVEVEYSSYGAMKSWAEAMTVPSSGRRELGVPGGCDAAHARYHLHVAGD